MNERRKLFYKTIGRWWAMSAQGIDWGQPDTPETLAAEDDLWASKDRFERGEIKLSEARPVFDSWVNAHRKAKREQGELLDAMRTHRRKEAHI